MFMVVAIYQLRKGVQFSAGLAEAKSPETQLKPATTWTVHHEPMATIMKYFHFVVVIIHIIRGL
jgi:hypothetical protein